MWVKSPDWKKTYIALGKIFKEMFDKKQQQITHSRLKKKNIDVHEQGASNCLFQQIYRHFRKEPTKKKIYD